MTEALGIERPNIKSDADLEKELERQKQMEKELEEFKVNCEKLKEFIPDLGWDKLDKETVKKIKKAYVEKLKDYPESTVRATKADRNKYFMWQRKLERANTNVTDVQLVSVVFVKELGVNHNMEHSAGVWENKLVPDFIANLLSAAANLRVQGVIENDTEILSPWEASFLDEVISLDDDEIKKLNEKNRDINDAQTERAIINKEYQKWLNELIDENHLNFLGKTPIEMDEQGYIKHNPPQQQQPVQRRR